MTRAKRKLLIGACLLSAGCLVALIFSVGPSGFRMSGVFLEAIFLLLVMYLVWMLPLGRGLRGLFVVLLIAVASVLTTYYGSLIFGKIEFHPAFILQDFLFHSLQAFSFLGLTRAIDREIEAVKARR